MTIAATAKQCRHCGRLKVNRPRGLCWSCYYAPGIREQYASTSKYANVTTRAKGTERDPETVLMVNCAGCSIPLLGLAEAEWWGSLTPSQQEQQPPIVTKYICERPACVDCARRVMQGGRL